MTGYATRLFIGACVALTGAATAFADDQDAIVGLKPEIRADAGIDVMTTAWEQVPGCAKRIAIVEPDQPFVTGCGYSDETQVFRLNNKGTFEPIGGKAISAVPRVLGTADYYAVTGDRRLTWNGSQGAAIPGDPCTRDASIGRSRADQTSYWVWVIGCTSLRDGVNLSISRWFSGARKPILSPGAGDVIDNSFQSYPGGAVRIAAGATDAVAWVINAPATGGGIFRQSYCKSNDADESIDPNNAFCKNIAPGWEQIPGCATSIGNGGDNRVWVVGCDVNADGEGAIYQYAGRADSLIAAGRWTKRMGYAKEIAVDWQGRPWVVKHNGTIWRWRLDIPAKGQRIESDPAPPQAADPK